ncbi:MAG: ABC transporter ATP-binding protein [Chloroflexota bacterium]|nr:ABC transporter ATP-binding protein [Chloroflexota bacterium]MDE2948912.1 ABC transporter ATP-binding protein [Chloroflexota bacterium]
MEIRIDNLTKKFGDVVGVENLTLHIDDGEFVAFLGPSGCGKTTTLLTLAGIYKPTDGLIRFGDRVVNTVQPKDRNIGMVFQSYALYPHMTIFQNIAYPLKLKKVPKNEQNEQVRRVANVMGIGDLLDRRPGQLSGGQQQRVALGRALVKEPDVLLFDEPLSNLDARLRLTMRGEIKHLQKNLGITSIYVTHDQVEAMTMADRIAVMNLGHLQAFDAPDELYDRPKTRFVAGFVGNPPMNFLDVEVSRLNGQFLAEADAIRLPLGAERGEPPAGHPGAVVMGIRPEDIQIADDGDVRGEIFVVEPLGREDLIDVRIGSNSFILLADTEKQYRAGQPVALKFDMSQAQFFDPQTERSLLWRQ